MDDGRSAQVTVSLDGHSLEVQGNFYAGTAAKVSGPPDSWCPGEPDEFEIDDVHLTTPHGPISLFLLPPSLLADDVLDRIEQAAIDALYRERDQ